MKIFKWTVDWFICKLYIITINYKPHAWSPNLNMPHMTPRPSRKSHTNLISHIWLDSFCPRKKIHRIRNNWIGLCSDVVALQWCRGFQENVIAFTETSLKKKKMMLSYRIGLEAINKNDTVIFKIFCPSMFLWGAKGRSLFLLDSAQQWISTSLVAQAVREF